MTSNIIIKKTELQKASSEGMDAFVDVFVNAIYSSIGGELNSETMRLLNSDQTTLLAYKILRDEVMDGGFVQLIHNGYGAFIFLNPFAQAIKIWGIIDLGRLINKVHSFYKKYRNEIEQECTDEDFMALFERFPKFDEFDDYFVENEERWTDAVACYIDEHIDKFATIET